MNPVLDLWSKTNVYTTLENVSDIPGLSGQKISARERHVRTTEYKRNSKHGQRPVILSAGHRHRKRSNGRKLISRTKVEFLPAIDSGSNHYNSHYRKYSSKSNTRSRTVHKDRSRAKVFHTERDQRSKQRTARRLKKNQSRSQKKFRRYVDELEKSVKKQHAAIDTAQPLYQSNQTRGSPKETILPPHLNLVEQHSYQTQSFAPKQVYANTINININNNAQNATNQQPKPRNEVHQVPEQHAMNEHLDQYWKDPISFPQSIHSPQTKARLDSYRSPPKITEHIKTVPANLSINDFITNWVADKKQFHSLQTFSRFKLKQLNDLFENRDAVENYEVATSPSRSGTSTMSTRGSSRGQLRSHAELFRRRLFPAKTTTDKVITETSFIAALCLDILGQMADKTENTNSKLLSRIATELAKCVFHQPAIHQWKKGDRTLAVDDEQQSENGDQEGTTSAIGRGRRKQIWFEDLKNITLDELCGLRSYKEKWFSVSSSITNVQDDFRKVESASRWVDNTKNKEALRIMRYRAFKIWKMLSRRGTLARKMTEHFFDSKSMKKHCFNEWKRKVWLQQKVFYNRKIRYLEQEQLRLQAEVEILQEIEESSKDQIRKFRTAMSVMAEYLHCDGTRLCEERTALRIHQMVKKMKLTLADSSSRPFLRELKFEEYLREFPTEQELLLKFDRLENQTTSKKVHKVPHTATFASQSSD